MKILCSILLLLILPVAGYSQKDHYQKQELKHTKQIFDHCEQNNYTRYPGTINVKETANYIYYEMDRIRIYLSYHFLIGFLSNNDTTSKEIFNTFKEGFGKLFEDGFLTGKMFICETNNDCEYNYSSGWMVFKGDSMVELVPDLFGYLGPTIKILNIKHIKELDTHTTRKFEIWATLSKMEDGWSGFPVFYLELTNKDARKETKFQDFIKGASLTCFRYGYSQI